MGVYGASGVETPNVDRLADNGLRFTDAHSTAATCTPSRYSLLTGEHGFRINAAILKGDAPALIKPGKPTLPGMLKKAGYTTGIVGKWHLGLGDGNMDWNGKIAPGPLEVGFDRAFLLPATGDRVPTVYIDDHKVVGLESADPIEVDYKKKVGTRIDGISNPGDLRVKADRQHSNTIVNGVSRIGYMGGGQNALWTDEDFPDVFTEKAIEFIRNNKDGPFFLFHSFHDIHVPRLPHPRFQGSSRMGPRGDAIVQMDWMVGQVMQELDRLGLTENTLVVFTSDNGPVLFDGYFDDAFEKLGDHQPAGPFRGAKTSLFEAGTRMPTILHWPAAVTAGESKALLSQVDLYASLANLVNQDLADGEAIDSLNLLDTFLGHSQSGREYLLEEGITGVAIRQGQWKYIPASKRENGRAVIPVKMSETGWSKQPQLYNLETDIGERVNLAKQMPEKVEELQNALDTYVNSGFRTHPANHKIKQNGNQANES
ncbi:MAG: arylsulfatase [Gammaproteobacteria bacterium]|nr:arylsulfatase [Gammaproteobacteria bacterium]